uniref:kelch-like protein 24 n=1 Tax=Styela clava TaxID=7725 RepID=UPI001939A546|nr:kelch-like protein 24 [Styela clava]
MGGSVSVEEREKENHAKDILTALNAQRQEEAYCDFVIKVGEEEFKAHQSILSASSRFFEAMLSSDMKVKEDGFVEIYCLDAKAFKHCIDFIYTGKVVFNLNETNDPKQMIDASEKLELTGLTDVYFKYWKDKLTVQQSLLYKELAQKYSRKEDEEYLENFIIKNFSEIMQLEDFKNIDKQQMIDYIRKLSDEKLKWEATTKWIDGDIENRKKILVELLDLINLKKLPKGFIVDKILQEPMIQESHECKDKLIMSLSR